MARDIEDVRSSDGVVYLKSRVPLAPFAKHIPEYLAKWAAERPDQVWLGERDGLGEWRTITYAVGKLQVDCLTEALLKLPRAEQGPLAILSGNSIEHALIAMAAMQARIPVAPISTAYSLQSSDHNKLKYIFDLIKPKTVFVQNASVYAKALSAVNADALNVVAVEGGERDGVIRFDALANTAVTESVAKSVAQIKPDTVAKLLFTSGSTGLPKAVTTTHQMMCANATMLVQSRVTDIVPSEATYLDWMPWNHVIGGSGVFNTVLLQGFSLYIDDGKPTPGQIEKTIRNLRDISPVSYTNAPAGYVALATALEGDDELREKFFKNLRFLVYGGARLPDDVYERFQKLAVLTTGKRIVFATTYGATETAPAATVTYWNTERVGLIGLPVAGVELKLVPLNSNKYEVRIKGVNVTPGYFNQPELSKSAFDDEGFYKIGDLAEFVDPTDVLKGLIFAGRAAEDFKLLSGTFVLVSSLRVDALSSMSPLVSDLLIAGQDREYVGALAWINLEACRRFVGNQSASVKDIVGDEKIREAIANGLRAHNLASGHAGSRSIRRVILLEEPPSIDANEITDKGYINQRTSLERRASVVERLYSSSPSTDVIEINC